MNLEKGVFRFEPAEKDSGARLDVFIPSCRELLSRTMVRKVVELGGIHVGGKRVRRCSHPVREGEKIELFLDGYPLDIFSLQDEHILFRDEFLIGINKPSGIETNPTPARYKGSLYEALLRFLKNPFRPLDKPELGMVQRLDRETSGVMVFSIHRKAHKPLTASFRERKVRKIYRALVEGHLACPKGEFRSLLARSHSTNRMKSVSRGGKEAITLYRVIQKFLGVSLVEVEIPTGRSHQIRVHFAEAGHPLLGDSKYGRKNMSGVVGCERTMLHACRIELRHPISGKDLCLEAPLPDDMNNVIRSLMSSKEE
jgi:23S rRNA pseudouridine1911/1915/1917 synthase